MKTLQLLKQIYSFLFAAKTCRVCSVAIDPVKTKGSRCNDCNTPPPKMDLNEKLRTLNEYTF